jgi:hypothetical protein
MVTSRSTLCGLNHARRLHTTLSLQTRSHINEHIAATFQCAAQIKAGWVSQCHAFFPASDGLLGCQQTLQLSLLNAAYSHQGFPSQQRVEQLAHRHAMRNRQAMMSVRVILALCIVIGKYGSTSLSGGRARTKMPVLTSFTHLGVRWHLCAQRMRLHGTVSTANDRP